MWYICIFLLSLFSMGHAACPSTSIPQCIQYSATDCSICLQCAAGYVFSNVTMVCEKTCWQRQQDQQRCCCRIETDCPESGDDSDSDSPPSGAAALTTLPSYRWPPSAFSSFWNHTLFADSDTCYTEQDGSCYDNFGYR